MDDMILIPTEILARLLYLLDQAAPYVEACSEYSERADTLIQQIDNAILDGGEFYPPILDAGESYPAY